MHFKTNGQVMLERNHQRSRSQSRRGAVAAETALVLGVLLTGLLGVFEFERLVMLRQLMNNGGCEGAPMAIVGTAPQPAITTQQATNKVNAYVAGQSIENVAVQVDPVTGVNLDSCDLAP
jgi:Flp pilus assembly protein TadG